MWTCITRWRLTHDERHTFVAVFFLGDSRLLLFWSVWLCRWQTLGMFVTVSLLVYYIDTSVLPQASKTHDSRNRSNINDLCTRIQWDVTALSARCYVTHWAVENTRDKIAQWNKMLLWNYENVPTLPGFCCPFGLFRRFLEVFRCLLQL